MDLTPLSPSGIITLTTDFGTTDLYVGVMKGVILNIHPTAQIVDITHAVPPQDIYAAAFLLETAYRYFPAGTAHVVVVDPGVGSSRRAIICQADTAYFVCPDNGVLSHLLTHQVSYHAVVVENEDYCLPQISNTFHGRDIFSPVAAHLSRGVALENFGQAIDDIVRFPIQTPKITEHEIVGHVVWSDRFGNLITNISHEILESFDTQSRFVIKAGRVEINRLNRSYAESEVGEFLAIIGSFGRLEISVNRGDAARSLGLKRGDLVRVCKTALVSYSVLAPMSK
jgi:S-adenosyl-L-methionine hydrolase (adenosine-forming)